MLSIFQNLVRLLKTDVGNLVFPRNASPENTDTPASDRHFSDKLPAAQTYHDEASEENMDTPAIGQPSPDESPTGQTDQDKASQENMDTPADGHQSPDESPTVQTHGDSNSQENTANPVGNSPVLSLSLENKGNTFVRVTLPPQAKKVPLKVEPIVNETVPIVSDESEIKEINQFPDNALNANEQEDKASQENMDTPAVGNSLASSLEAKNQMDTTAVAKQYTPNSPEAQKAIAMRYYNEILNDANLATIDELMSPDFIFTIPTHPDPYRGPEGFKDLIRMLHGAFPDVHLKVEHLLVDGYTVVGHWTGSGTHTGGALHTVKGDIPATGKRFVIDGVSWLKIVNGKIVESLANEDTLSLLRQVGVLPPAREATKSIVRTYFNEVLNRGELDRLNEIIAPEFVMHEPMLLEPVSGLEGLKNHISLLRDGFPDIRYTVDRETADKEMAAIRWTMTGTHQNDFLGTPPSGKSVSLQGVNIFRLREGKIVEIWVNENALGLLDQISAIP